MTNAFDAFDAPAQGGNPFDKVEQKPDIGRLKAFEVGARQGVTANFSDELAGAHAAGRVANFDLPGVGPIPVQTLMGLARLGLDYFGSSGGQGATEAYEGARDQSRAEGKTAQEQYPGTTLAGNIAGGVAMPVARVGQAATLPARMLRGAEAGAVFGAASGVGEGETAEERLKKGLSGGVIGGATGALATPIVEGAVRAIGAGAGKVANTWRGLVNPEAEAARRVTGAIERDIEVDPAAVQRLDALEWRGARNEGQPVTNMDMGGETTRALARSAANVSPEGRAVLNMGINDRFEGQTGRIGDWFRTMFHYPNADAQQQAIEHVGRATNNEAYRRAYREGAEGLWSPELERLAGSDAVTGAMQKAATVAKDEAIVSGYGAMNPRISFTQDGRIQFNRGPNGVPTYPDLQYWDLVRRELSDASRRAGPGTSEARRLNNFATALNSELDTLVPSYQQARQGAAGFFGAENALEAGQNFVTQRFGRQETQRAINQMNPTERRLFQDGYVDRFVERLEETGNRRDALNRIMSNPAEIDKMNMAIGPQRTAELEARLRIEGVMDFARRAVQGNSTTARQLTELGLAGGVGGASWFGGDPNAAGNAAIAWALMRGNRAIDQRVARRVSDMLMSNDPRVLQRGVNMVARNDRMMNALRSADWRIAMTGGQQGTNVMPAIQGPMRSAAEQEQN